MFRFLPYILKNLWRHRARTLLTASGAAVAMFVFCFVGAIQEGLERVVSGEFSRKTLIVFQENRFCPTTSRLPESYVGRVEEIPGVVDVMPIQVWTNNCRASLDIVVFNGAPPDQLRQRRDFTLEAGSWSEFSSTRNNAIVGSSLALRENLSVGEQFSKGPLSVHIAGIFSSRVPAQENLIYTSLKYLQYTKGLNAAGLVTQLEVLVAEGADPDEVARAIDKELRAGPVATTTRRKGAFQASTLSDLLDVIGFAHWLGYACVGLVLSIVATTTLMSVQDRRMEYAVLQTLGVRPGRVFRFVLAESLLLCLIGGFLGTAAALAVLAWSGMAIGAEGVTIAFRPSLTLALTGTAVSFLLGLAAGLIPAIQAARGSILEGLRDG